MLIYYCPTSEYHIDRQIMMLNFRLAYCNITSTFNTMQQSKPQKPKSREWLRPLWLLTTVGWSVALSLIIPTAIGYWVDQPAQLNRQPLFTLVGFGVGTLVAFFTLYRLLHQFYNEQKEKNKEEVKKQQ
jgi:cytochrome bd-type quinol oxidase subunit 2